MMPAVHSHAHEKKIWSDHSAANPCCRLSWPTLVSCLHATIIAMHTDALGGWGGADKRETAGQSRPRYAPTVVPQLA